jgi:hypothetical protein
MTNTHDAHLQGLTDKELRSVITQILDETIRLECLPSELWVAVRMFAEDEDSMQLYGVGILHQEEYPREYDWSYTPGHQVLREVQEVLKTRAILS